MHIKQWEHISFLLKGDVWLYDSLSVCAPESTDRTCVNIWWGWLWRRPSWGNARFSTGSLVFSSNCRRWKCRWCPQSSGALAHRWHGRHFCSWAAADRDAGGTPAALPPSCSPLWAPSSAAEGSPLWSSWPLLATHPRRSLPKLLAPRLCSSPVTGGLEVLPLSDSHPSPATCGKDGEKNNKKMKGVSYYQQSGA